MSKVIAIIRLLSPNIANNAMTVTWLQATAVDFSARSNLLSSALASLLCAQGLFVLNAVDLEMEQ